MVEKENYMIRQSMGGCIACPVLLHLLENGPCGISVLLDEGLGSNSGLYRVISKLKDAGLVVDDESRQLQGKPIKLTVPGKEFANHVQKMEQVLIDNKK